MTPSIRTAFMAEASTKFKLFGFIEDTLAGLLEKQLWMDRTVENIHFASNPDAVASPMTLPLPDETALAAFGEDQRRLELACGLYSTRGISRGLAANLAGIEVEAFEAELHSRDISNGIKPSDLDADLSVLNQLLKA